MSLVELIFAGMTTPALYKENGKWMCVRLCTAANNHRIPEQERCRCQWKSPETLSTDWWVMSILFIDVSVVHRVYKEENLCSPKKFKITQSATKVMATVFGAINHIILVDFLKDCQTINASCYSDFLKNFLKPKLRKKWSGLLVTSGVCFLQDNSRPHTDKLTIETLTELGWDIVHPPYSTDMAPCDYHLFGLLNEFLGRSSDQMKRQKGLYGDGSDWWLLWNSDLEASRMLEKMYWPWQEVLQKINDAKSAVW